MVSVKLHIGFQLLSIPFILIGVYLLLRKIPQKELDRMRESGEAAVEKAG